MAVPQLVVDLPPHHMGIGAEVARHGADDAPDVAPVRLVRLAVVVSAAEPPHGSGVVYRQNLGVPLDDPGGRVAVGVPEGRVDPLGGKHADGIVQPGEVEPPLRGLQLRPGKLPHPDEARCPPPHQPRRSASAHEPVLG